MLAPAVGRPRGRDDPLGNTSVYVARLVFPSGSFLPWRA